MPPTQGDLLELLRSAKSAAEVEGDDLVCVLEEVSGFAGKGQPGSAMFTFGEHYGFTKGVVQALGIRLELVRPQVWQKTFGLGTASRCASKSEWKNKLKAEAQRRFPHLKVTLKTADALLILDWVMRRGLETRPAANAEILKPFRTGIETLKSGVLPDGHGARGATSPTSNETFLTARTECGTLPQTNNNKQNQTNTD